ncbi:MAG: hypothetical protein ABSC94_33720 [Polyangiaceae bacterium]|jgi:hypothetical protein
MSARITVRILPSSTTRVLVTDGKDEVLKAQLPTGTGVHRLAAKTLLEAIALFYQERIRVVLSADSEAISFDLGLTDGLGLGIDTFYYEVEVLPDASRRRRAKRLYGLGDFRDMRRLVGS